MYGNGVMIGMIVTIINHHQNVIRKVQHQAATECCVGAIGSMMRGSAVFRAVPTAIPTGVTTTAVCASPSQFDNREQGAGSVEQVIRKIFKKL